VVERTQWVDPQGTERGNAVSSVVVRGTTFLISSKAYFPFFADSGMNFISASQAKDWVCQASHISPL
jgi:hypothetical protein